MTINIYNILITIFLCWEAGYLIQKDIYICAAFDLILAGPIAYLAFEKENDSRP